MADQKDDIIDFTGIINGVLYPFALLKRYFRLSIIYLLVGAVAAVILKFTLTPLYASTFIVKSNENRDLFFINMIIDLQTLVQDNDNNGLAQELNVSEAHAKSLKKLTYVAILNSKSADSSRAISITLRMNEYDHFLEIQNAIIKYLNNNPHYGKLKGIRLSNLEDLKKKINADIREMDSVKKIIVDNIKPAEGKGNGLVYNVPVDPYKAYDINMGRYKELLWLVNQQKSTDSFELIKPCVVSKKPVWPKLTILLLTLIPISFVLSIIHAHRKEVITKKF